MTILSTISKWILSPAVNSPLSRDESFDVNRKIIVKIIVIPMTIKMEDTISFFFILFLQLMNLMSSF